MEFTFRGVSGQSVTTCSPLLRACRTGCAPPPRSTRNSRSRCRGGCGTWLTGGLPLAALLARSTGQPELLLHDPGDVCPLLFAPLLPEQLQYFILVL